jgi:hypothetical protein
MTMVVGAGVGARGAAVMVDPAATGGPLPCHILNLDPAAAFIVP